MELRCFGKKRITNLFCLLYLYISIIKVNITSKFTLATNVMYVLNVYMDFIRDVQRSETKKSKHKIKQRSKFIDKY